MVVLTKGRKNIFKQREPDNEGVNKGGGGRGKATGDHTNGHIKHKR